MGTIIDFIFNAENIIRTAGYAGIFGIIFAESGFFFGFFLPGDSLLFTAGFLASQAYLNLFAVIAGSFIAAVLGDNFGYGLGHRFGPRIFADTNSAFFNKEYLTRAEEFYRRYGGKAVVFARFLPVVRSAAPVLAGAGNMYYPKFLFYNVAGAVLWAGGLTVLGFYLGRVIPNIDTYLLPIVAGIIVVSLLPGIISVFTNKTLRKEIWRFIRRVFKKDR